MFMSAGISLFQAAIFYIVLLLQSHLRSLDVGLYESQEAIADGHWALREFYERVADNGLRARKKG